VEPSFTSHGKRGWAHLGEVAACYGALDSVVHWLRQKVRIRGAPLKTAAEKSTRDGPASPPRRQEDQILEALKVKKYAANRGGQTAAGGKSKKSIFAVNKLRQISSSQGRQPKGEEGGGLSAVSKDGRAVN